MILFNKSNKAVARKTDPKSSQDAADRLNAVDGVTKQEREVLAALRKYGRCGASPLGALMAWQETGIELDIISQIVRIHGKAHRRLSAMVADGIVKRNEDGTYEVVK